MNASSLLHVPFLSRKLHNVRTLLAPQGQGGGGIGKDVSHPTTVAFIFFNLDLGKKEYEPNIYVIYAYTNTCCIYT